jgi:hypothetical protein
MEYSLPIHASNIISKVNFLVLFKRSISFSSNLIFLSILMIFLLLRNGVNDSFCVFSPFHSCSAEIIAVFCFVLRTLCSLHIDELELAHLPLVIPLFLHCCLLGHKIMREN